MIAIVSCVAGVLGMLVLWIWAWRLWKRSAVPPLRPEPQRSVGPDDSRPRPRVPTLPPSWLFEDSAGELDLDAPRAREQPSSNAVTDLFAREERTEVLGGRTCKIGLFRPQR